MLNFSIFGFFDYYSMFMYFLQQYLVHIFVSLHDNYQVFLYIIFFCFGIITVLTPCFFSMLPVLFISINIRENDNKNIIFCITGLLVSFCLVIFLTYLFSSSYLVRRLPVLSYSILFLLSLDFMKILDLSGFYNYLSSVLRFNQLRSFVISSYFIGFLVGLSSLPCSTPIVLLINVLLLNYSNVFSVILSMIFYSVGFILCILFIFKLNFLYSSKSSFFSIFLNYCTSFSGYLLFIISLSSCLKIIFI